MDEITKSYYENYLTFSIFLEFRIVDKTKFFKDKTGKDTKRNIMFSRYAQNIEEVQKIIDDYNTEQYIVYVGSNTRSTKSRTDASIDFRRTFFFDIEYGIDGEKVEKPPLTDEVYYSKLKDTARYVYEKLLELGIEMNMLKESGRGLHCGVIIKNLSIKEYDKQFKVWWKEFTTEIEEGRPHKDIKFSDNMSNPSRIESAPGTIHFKYPEKPMRRVLFLELHENDIIPIINRVKVFQPKVITTNTKIKKSDKDFYDDETIYTDCPEWLLLQNHRNLPEGSIHNTIIAMLKCLVRDNNLDALKMQTKLQELGYLERVDSPHNMMVYTRRAYLNWCEVNFVYCADNEVEMYQQYEKYNIAPITRYNDLNIEDRKLNTYREVKDFIKEFNTKTAVMIGTNLAILEEELKQRVQNNCYNPKLWKFIKKYGLWNVLRGEIMYGSEIKRLR